jgi:Putative MetA-pathway of phenol degradation
MNLVKYFILSGLLVALVHVAWAQPAPPESADTAEVSPPKQVDRTRYNPFNPTPSNEMRDFWPDRPYVTDSPYTVDPGHWLLEAGLFEYTRDRYNNSSSRVDGFAFGDMNIRLGVTSYADLEFLFTAYSYLLTTDKNTGTQLKQSGFSDCTLKSKINILGDDGGPVAIALIPFVTFPTGAAGVSAGGFAGGLALPVEFTLPAGFQLRTENAILAIQERGDGSHFDYLASASLGHPITKRLSTYVEFTADIDPPAHDSWLGTVDTGLIFQPASNWQLDAGVNIGVTKPAHDLFFFFGAAWRY